MSNEDNVQTEVENTSNVEQPVTETVKEYSEIEKQAMQMGWDPNHSGKTFVPAEEYVNRAPLFNRIEEQSKQIKELRNLVKQTADHMSSVRKEAYEKAIRDLEQKKLEAVSTGDVAQYQRVEQEATSIKNQMVSDPFTTPKPEVNPEISDWVQQNKHWYNQDNVENRKMSAAAEAIDTFLSNQARIDQNTSAGQMPNLDLKEHFKAVEKEVKRLFPHRFENMNREQAPAVGKSTTGTSNKTVQKGLEARLTPQQRILGEKFQKSNPEYTLEKYAADLEAMGRLNK